jgi:phosphatidylinositol glycan class B
LGIIGLYYTTYQWIDLGISWLTIIIPCTFSSTLDYFDQRWNNCVSMRHYYLHINIAYPFSLFFFFFFFCRSILLLLNVFIDTYFYTGHLSIHYQEWVFVPWTFIKTNIFQSIAIFYGAHPFHWYLSQGLPLMLLTFLPLTLLGFSSSTAALKHIVIWVVCVYSLLSHKEFRFLYPIFPLLMIFTANGLYMVWRKLTTKLRWVLILVLWSTQWILALYVSLWHQRGVMDVMIWLRQQQQQQQSTGFLMPCHSTPWHSIMHQDNDQSIWFLTCDPPLIPGTEDEADLFYKDPVTFLSTLHHPWPTMLVMFDPLLATPGVPEVFESKGYVECQRFFNSHVHWDKRRKGDVVVLCHGDGVV